jgi:hypothetical protein
MTVQEMARTMLKYSKLGDIFWAQEVHTTVHILNRGMLRSNSDKTPYELWKGRPKNVNHFRVFGSKCYIKREDDRIGKFDSRVDKGIFVGYSSKSKAYKCFNMRLNRIVESINVQIDETSVQNPKEERKDSTEQEGEEDLKEEVEEAEEEEEEENQKQRKRKMTNKIFRYLPKLLADECRKIIHQNRSLGINMQELKPKENYAHQNKDI